MIEVLQGFVPTQKEAVNAASVSGICAGPNWAFAIWDFFSVYLVMA
ncbi:hypothetical protein [Streptomyces graminofaciens]|nr:hypothetical protein [Streptomyces graminofaciens]